MIENLRIYFFVFLSSVASIVVAEQADSVYRNGAIYTVNDDQPWAQAIAVKRQANNMAISGSPNQ